MLLVPSIYPQIYNQCFAIGWNHALGQILAFRAAKSDAQAQQEMLDWFNRHGTAEKAASPSTNPNLGPPTNRTPAGPSHHHPGRNRTSRPDYRDGSRHMRGRNRRFLRLGLPRRLNRSHGPSVQTPSHSQIPKTARQTPDHLSPNPRRHVWQPRFPRT